MKRAWTAESALMTGPCLRPGPGLAEGTRFLVGAISLRAGGRVHSWRVPAGGHIHPLRVRAGGPLHWWSGWSRA